MVKTATANFDKNAIFWPSKKRCNFQIGGTSGRQKICICQPSEKVSYIQQKKFIQKLIGSVYMHTRKIRYIWKS